MTTQLHTGVGHDSDDFGVLYMAVGERCIEEVCRSAASLKKLMPEIRIALFVNDKSGIPAGLFDRIEIVESPSYQVGDKISCLSKTPFVKTLFLDTDTLIIEPFYELIDLLDRFDLAVCHAPYRFCQGVYKHKIMRKTSKAFTELNTGMILYKKTEKVLNLFVLWEKLNRRNLSEGFRHDQPGFRQAIYESDVVFTILVPEYNLRVGCPYFVGGRAKAKILHGKAHELRKAERRVNRSLLPRVSPRPKLFIAFCMGAGLTVVVFSIFIILFLF